MTDERTIELINAGIDGELDATTRAELESALRTDPQARAVHDDLARMAAALQRMTPVAVPAQIHERVTAAISTAPRSRMLWSKRWLRRRHAGAGSGEIIRKIKNIRKQKNK